MIKYFFPNEKDQRDFKFSGISEQSLGEMFIKES